MELCRRNRTAHVSYAREMPSMYGLIGKIRAKTGKREDLVAILLEGTERMPGCLSYVVAKDTESADDIWITEVWRTKEQHVASLSLPQVQDAISRGKPLIAGFQFRVETEPVERS